MNIIICGAGEVGRHSAEVLAAKGHNVTVIDLDAQKLQALDAVLDVRSLRGNGTQADVLLEAGCATADLFIAATSLDEVNLLSASIAKGVGVTKCIARVHHSAYFEQRGLSYTRHLGIDHLVCPEHSTSLAIASTLRAPGAIAVEQFARGKVEMQYLPVDAAAQAVGKTLRDLQMPGSARLAAIERGDEAFLPNADTKILADDVVTLIGDADDFGRIRKLFQTVSDSRRRVMIMGGTTQSVWVCRALRSKRFSVRLFEADPDRARQLSEKLGWVTVLNADVINTDVLQEEHVEMADAFAALTEDDEENILAAARAKSMGAKRAMAVLQRPTYLHLLEHIGIDQAFSPRSTAVTEIERRLDDSPVRHLATLTHGIGEVYEIRVGATATKALNIPLRDIKLPPGSMVAAIQRQDDVFVPGAASTVEDNDVAIVIAPKSSRKTLIKLFGGRPASAKPAAGWLK